MIAVMFGAMCDPLAFITAFAYIAAGIYFSNKNINRLVLGKEIA